MNKLTNTTVLTFLAFFSLIHILPSNTHENKRIVNESVKLSGKLSIQFLNNQNIIIVGNYNDFMKARILKECNDYLKRTTENVWWSYEFSRDFAALEVVNDYRPKISKAFSIKEHFSISDNSISSSSYWMNSIGKMRLKDPFKNNQDIELKNGVEVAHFAYLELEKSLISDQFYTIKTKNKESISFKYDEQTIVSRAIKVNQVGYHPNSGQKFAYLGMWLGMQNRQSKSLNLQKWLGKEFHLLNTKGEKAFTGKIEFRKEDERDTKGFPVTGETVYQLDFSNFKLSGEYRIHIEGIGNSWPFKISTDAIGEAFYIHTRGLYHKRCGIAKESPYTHWHCGPCHMHSYQGGHISDDQEYKNITDNGEKTNYKPFGMIRDTTTDTKLPVFGGWHDAADYDRRPLHFSAVQDLLTPYLLEPNKFTDGQLNIPESGNGIPDILDEADWGMRVWLRAQKEDGAVGTWIEATSHPKEHNPAKDKQPYYLSEASRASTLEYAAHAGLIANAYKVSGHGKRENEYKLSAIKAFNWAMNPENQLKKNWQGKVNDKLKKLSYVESDLKQDMIFKAALNLYRHHRQNYARVISFY